MELSGRGDGDMRGAGGGSGNSDLGQGLGQGLREGEGEGECESEVRVSARARGEMGWILTVQEPAAWLPELSIEEPVGRTDGLTDPGQSRAACRLDRDGFSWSGALSAHSWALLVPSHLPSRPDQARCFVCCKTPPTLRREGATAVVGVGRPGLFLERGVE